MNNKIKVVQVVDSLDKGGAETVAVDTANNLDRNKFESYLCATRKRGSLQNKIEKHVKFLFLKRKSAFDLKAALDFMRFLKREKMDIIHSHGSSVFFSNISRKLSGKKVLHIMTDNYGRKIEDRSGLLSRLLLRNLSKVICASNHLRRYWTGKVGIKEVIFVPNGIDYGSLFSQSKKRIKNQIVICANFRKQKDHANLINAAYMLKEKGINFKIILIGEIIDREYFKAIQAKIRELELQDYVLIKGFVENPSNYLLESSIGVLSSESEALPLSLLEYMGAGLAIVVTDVGDCRHVLGNGKLGIIIPPRNPRALADALEKLLANPKLRSEYGSNAKKVAFREFDIKAYIKRIESIYSECRKVNI